MKTVCLIYEEDHAMIGVAKDYKSSIDFLINEDWLCGSNYCCDDNEKERTLKEFLGENWENIIKNEWDIEDFNWYLNDTIVIRVLNVYESEE